MQRSKATTSKRKQGYASESTGKQGKPRESTRELRSLALLARFARPPAIITRVKTQQRPAKARKAQETRKGWERLGKARKDQQSPAKSRNNAEKALERPTGSQNLQNPPKTLPKPSQDPPESLPRPSQTLPKCLKNRNYILSRFFDP